MDYVIRVRNGGQEYRVPEDMIPRVAQAMLDGDTADKVEQKKTLIERAASMARGAQNAARQHFPFSPRINLSGRG